MTTAFKGLIGSQCAVGFFMFVFGLVDKLKVKSLLSFILLPIWIGILVSKILEYCIRVSVTFFLRIVSVDFEEHGQSYIKTYQISNYNCRRELPKYEHCFNQVAFLSCENM